MRATGKPFNIEKKRVYEAYKAVKSNGGAAGVDGQTIEQFEADLKNNLYKIWNREWAHTAESLGTSSGKETPATYLSWEIPRCISSAPVRPMARSRPTRSTKPNSERSSPLIAG